MIYPSISDLTKEKYNRYELVIAVAKSARMITDEYVKERETAEKMTQGTKDADKAAFAMIKREFRDEKAVKSAINRLFTGDFIILDPETAAQKRAARAESQRLAEENRLLAEEAKRAFALDFSSEDEDADDEDIILEDDELVLDEAEDRED